MKQWERKLPQTNVNAFFSCIVVMVVFIISLILELTILKESCLDFRRLRSAFLVPSV